MVNATCSCQHEDPHPKVQDKKKSVLFLPNLKVLRKKPSTQYCAVLGYLILAVIALVTSLAVITSASASSILIKEYDSEQPSRVIGSIILAVSGVVTAIIVVIGIVAICKKKPRSIHTTAMFLISLALLQALLLGLFVSLKKTDIMMIQKSLTDSFVLARNKNEIKVKLFDVAQSQLQCCGVHGPQNYELDPELKVYQVPFSCCPTYKPNETDFYQTWQRDICIVNKMYHKQGCLEPILNMQRITSAYTTGFSVLLIVVTVLLAAIGIHLSKQRKKELARANDNIEIPQTLK